MKKLLQLPATIARYLQMFRIIAGMQLKIALAYRTDVALWALISIVWTLFNFFFFAVLVQVRGDLAGWSQPQVYVLVGVFTILDAFIWSWLSRSMQQMTESIYQGSLDLVLVKPVDTQFYLSFNRFNYTNLVRVILGLVLIFANLTNSKSASWHS
jgi:ABC-2 type transport system permease protein